MQKYYDLSREGTNLGWFFGIGLTVLILSVVIWFYLMVIGKSLAQKVRIGLVILISFVWTMVIWIGSYRHYLDAKEALSKNALPEVSGIVEDFDPMPVEGHKNESFTVSGVHFEYSDFEIGFGFNQSRSHGGPIDKGKYVRIQYYEGRILRLWVKEE